MAKDKPQPQTGPEIEEYSTTATPKAYAGSVPVFCAHDAIVPLKDLRPNPKNPNQHPPEQIKLLASIIRAARTICSARRVQGSCGSIRRSMSASTVRMLRRSSAVSTAFRVVCPPR